MELSVFLFRVIFLALPGIITILLFRKLRGKPIQKDWEDFIEIWFYSVLSYAICGLVIEVYNWKTGSSHKLKITDTLFDEKAPFSWKQIAAASATSVILAVIASYLSANRVINKLGLKINVTDRYDDADVWECFNEINRNRWVIVRDNKLNLAYYGWIKFYSDSEKVRELVLNSVTTYSNSTWEVLYESETLYISREKSDLTIELASSTSSTTALTSTNSTTTEKEEIVNVNQEPRKFQEQSN